VVVDGEGKPLGVVTREAILETWRRRDHAGLTISPARI